MSLDEWKITLSANVNGGGKVDHVDVGQLQRISRPEFFYLDEGGRKNFVALSKVTTTSRSLNERSELSQMIRGKNSRITTGEF
jgi:hypothetical protein